MSVSIYEAKTHLSQLIATVEATGEEIIIRRHNVPVAKLVPFRPVIAPRVLGGWEGRVTIHDDFDDLPDDVAAAFAGQRP
ncbi:MAG TPA: type II toxin-antitoxin system prevent-host-death family antitoxin [Ilumatobacteraceae bacterium]|nr:type II toxin-antitoxin system prevent-host-death family antitoxin [Ilumatobacteraceae bacterium]